MSPNPSSMGIPRAVGVFLLLAAAVSILFVANQEEESPMHISRFLKDDEMEAHQVAKTKDSKAPLFMQDTTGQHVTNLFMQKYGMTQTKKTSKTPEKSAAAGPAAEAMQKAEKKDKTGKLGGIVGQLVPSADKEDVTTVNTDDSYTWVYARVTSQVDCQGREYMTGGLRADTCVSIPGGTSMMATCNENGVSMYTYGSNNCAGKPSTSSLVAKLGCQLPINTPWGAYTDDDSYSDSIEISCVTADVSGPVVGTTHYDVMAGFLSKCDAEEFYYFEAYSGDTCIPFETYEGATNVAGMFKYGGDGSSLGIYAKMYGTSKKCQGAKSKVFFPKGCNDSTQWLYYYNM